MSTLRVGNITATGGTGTITVPTGNQISQVDRPSGLVLVKTQTIGTAVSSVTVTNAFSADFDNYRIVMNSIGSASHSIDLKLGASTTGYFGSLIYADATVGTVQVATRNNAAQLNWLGGCQGANQPSVVSFDIFNPFAATFTKISNGAYQDGSYYGTMQGEHRVSTSYTDFILTPNSGTLTGGTIRVYGYRNS